MNLGQYPPPKLPLDEKKISDSIKMRKLKQDNPSLELVNKFAVLFSSDKDTKYLKCTTTNNMYSVDMKSDILQLTPVVDSEILNMLNSEHEIFDPSKVGFH
jgi:hypothetical protein